MGKYIVTGTDKKTGKREVLSHYIRNSKQEADKLAKGLTFNQYKDVPKGMTKKQVTDMLKYKNIKVKRIL